MSKKLFLAFIILSLPHCRGTAGSQSALKVDTDFSEARDGSEVIDLTTYITPESQHAAMEAVVMAELKRLGPTFEELEARFKKVEGENLLPENIPKYEVLALMLYTGSGYLVINISLRRTDVKQPKDLQAITKAAVSALNKVKPEPCISYRRTDLPDGVVAQLRQGVHFYDPAFLSSTYSEAVMFPGKYLFVIQSNECRKIDWISMSPHEKEVLWAPGSDFLMTSVDPGGGEFGADPSFQMIHRHLDKNEKLKSQKIAWDGSAEFLGASSSSDVQGKTYSSVLLEGQSGDNMKASIFFGANGQGKITLPKSLSNIGADPQSNQATFNWVRQGDLIETSKPGSTTKIYYYIFSEFMLGQLRAKNSDEINVAKEVVAYFRSE